MSKNANRNSGQDPAALMASVSRQIEARELTLRQAAAVIGVGLNTLEKHLGGEHVRSAIGSFVEVSLDGPVEPGHDDRNLSACAAPFPPSGRTSPKGGRSWNQHPRR
jgi:hypothetical protein